MGKEQDERKTEYDLDRLIQSSYGLNDDQILERMKVAEETVGDSQIPPEQEDGFQRLWKEVEARKLEPHFTEDYEDNGEDNVEREGGGKRRALRRIFRFALAAGALAVILAMTSITSGAKRKYWYEQSTRENEKNDKAVDNEMNEKRGGDLAGAYEDIYQEIGINVLQLGYMPEGMTYTKSAVNKRHAAMYFDYMNHRFYMIQQLRTEENSSTVVSDRKEEKTVYNPWLRMEITVEEAATEDGEKEYSTQFVVDDAYYYIAGIMDEKEFELIIRGLTWRE